MQKLTQLDRQRGLEKREKIKRENGELWGLSLLHIDRENWPFKQKLSICQCARVLVDKSGERYSL